MTEQNYGETLTHKLAVPAGLELDNFSGARMTPWTYGVLIRL